MNYLQRNKPLQKWTSRPITAILIIIGIVALYLVGWNFLNPIFFAIGKPIWSFKNYVSDQTLKIWSSIEDKEYLAAENVKLQQELSEAKLALDSLDAYKKENEFFKSLLGRSGNETRIIAAILTKPSLSPYDTITLDAGTNQNVHIGDKVMSSDFVIGIIKETQANYSKAVMLSSAGESLNVTIGDSNIVAVAIGRGGGNFSVKLPKEIDVKKGDLIKLPGLNQKFFGIVGSVEQTLTGSFQTILFNLPVNINELGWVEIIKS